MAAVGQGTQNAHAERVLRTIKEEEVYLADYESFDDAYHRIGHFIDDVHQTKRIHSALVQNQTRFFDMWYNCWHEKTSLCVRT